MIGEGIIIEPQMGLFPPTFVTDTSTIVIQLTNPLNTTFHGEWRSTSDTSEEKEILKFVDTYSPLERQKIRQLLEFKSQIFSFDTSPIEVGPGRTQRIAIKFTPQESINIKETVYLFNTDTEERLAFQLQGCGVPPEAELNVDSINTGHILLDNTYEYQVLLKNLGKIPLTFQVDMSGKRTLDFEFNPMEGYIDVGAFIPINCKVSATKVGQFSEIFPIIIQRNEHNSPALAVRGRVVGPSFEINPHELNFGTVSFGFLYTQTFELKNTSDIPLDYDFIIHQDKSFDKREFNIQQNCGTVPRHSSKFIKLEFLPIALRDYSIEMILENPKFESSLATIPIQASCICPEVSMVTKEIDVGPVYINNRSSVFITLENKTDFQAKYEFVQTTDAASLDADFDIEKRTGPVKARGKTELKFYLTPKQIGQFELNRFIQIQGSEYDPLPFTIRGTCIGPTLKLSEKEIAFGKCHVLQDTLHELIIDNKSPIPAPFTVSLKGSEIFKVTPESGIIPENSNIHFQINATANDTVTFNAQLNFIFDHLSPFNVPITARGVGCPIIASMPMELFDNGFSFVGETVTKDFQLTNHGRRAIDIKWELKKEKGKNEGSPKRNNHKNQPTFVVTPDQRVIQPNETVPFVFTVTSAKAVEYNIKVTCTATLGKKKTELYHPIVQGNFIQPLLEIEKPEITFEYTHNVEAEEKLTGGRHYYFEQKPNPVLVPSKELLQKISFKNSFISRSELPLTVYTECEHPFSIYPKQFETVPNEPNEFEVVFDPSFKRDFSSEIVNSHLYFKFNNNPQKFSINLTGILKFPNVSFNPQGHTYDFGVLIKNTEAQQSLQIANTSEVHVQYEWFLQSKNPQDSPSSIFDIMPMRGSLNPGQTEEITINFFAFGDKTSADYNATAICHILGGPDYVFTLKGQSAPTDFKISPTSIDFGKRAYTDQMSGCVVLQNLSLVPLDFKVRIGKNISFASFSVSPMHGKVPPKSVVSFNISAVPGFPKQFQERIIIQVGLFEEVEIELSAECFFNQLQTDMPRSPDDALVILHSKKPKRHGINDNGGNISPNHFSALERELMLNRLTELSQMPTTPPKSVVIKKNQKVYQGEYSSTFLVDLGTLLLGQKLTKTFKFNSITPYPISFELFTNSLQGTGFAIEPEKFADIPPNESYSITFKFDCSLMSKTTTGDVTYNVPLVFKDETAYLIQLHAQIQMPFVEFSTTAIDFDTTIVGQKRIQTFQVQNKNNIPVKLHILPVQETTMVQKAKNKSSPCFSVSPEECTLPSQSFVNIDVIFSPDQEKQYSQQFPIKLYNNSQTFYLAVKGAGAQMKLMFEPQKLTFPPILPYEDTPIERTFHMINPTPYPITVASTQFDFLLLVDQLQQQRMLNRSVNQSTTSLETTPSSSNKNLPQNNRDVNNGTISSVASSRNSKLSHVSQKATGSKFQMCVIVHGAVKSGKSTVARMLELFLGLPIIEAATIFGGKQNIEECTEGFQNLIKDQKYNRGFIIDGLTGLAEPPETEKFVEQTLKHKNIQEEIAKNPFQVFPHQVQTAYEQALNCILTCLQDFYVFGLFVSASDEVIAEHTKKYEDAIKKETEEKRRSEIEAFFNMSQEDYDKLTDEEKKEIDEKRNNYREEFLKSKEEVEEPKTSPPSQKGKNHPKAKQKAAKAPANPIEIQNNVYRFTLGNIVQKLKDTLSMHKVVDPYVLMNVAETDITIQHSLNCAVIDISKELDNIETDIKSFIPSYDTMKSLILNTLLPTQRILLPSDDPEKQNQLKLENMPQYFGIVNDEIPMLPQTPHGQNPRKAPRSSRRQNRDAVADETLFEGIDLIQYSKRFEIPAEGQVEVAVKFLGQNIGEYKDELRFCIVDSTFQIYTLPVSGVIVYPEIDRSPESIYSKIVPNYNLKVKSAFIKSSKIFHIGSVISLTGKLGGKNFQPAYKNSISIHNPGPLPVTLTPNLRDGSTKTVGWYMDQKPMTIQPEETTQINFGFHPLQPDQYTNRISLFIKDNPDPYFVDINADVCIPAIEASTLNLDFDRILPSQEKEITFELKNVSHIPAFFKFKGHNQIGPFFKFSDEQGKLLPNAVAKISVNYQCAKVNVIKKPFTIEVFDENQTKMFSQLHMNVSAETFDAACEIIFPKNMKSIAFGPQKIKTKRDIQIQLKNKGKYPFDFKLIVAKKAASYLKVSQADGTLSPTDKPIPINITFEPPKAIKIDNQNLIQLQIIESTTKDLVNTVQLQVSGEASYATYEITPADGIEFGSVIANKPQTMQFEIKNTGDFPFEFDISPMPESTMSFGNPDDSPSNKKKKGRKSITNSSSRVMTSTSKKSRGGKQAIGPFIFSTAYGTVNPGASQVVQVDYNPQRTGVYQVTAIIKVTDTKDGDNGVLYNVHGEAFVPEFVSDQYENIFVGQVLCLRSDIKTKDITAFLEDDKCLHFRTQCVGSSEVVPVTIANKQPVPVDVDLILTNTTGSSVKLSKQEMANLVSFSISETTLTLQPNTSQVVDLTFKPKACNIYTSTFEVKIKGSSKDDKRNLKISLEGKGSLPLLEFLDPEQQPQYNFGKTLVGSTKEKEITLINRSDIDTSINFSAKANADFEIQGIYSIQAIVLKPKQTFTFNVVYRPSKAKKHSLDLQANVKGNADSNIKMQFNGEGLLEDVIIDGPAIEDDTLFFNDVMCTTSLCRTFLIKNVSHTPIRYQWFCSNAEFVFSPSVGHLEGESVREISVTFTSDKPQKPSFKVSCVWQHIKTEEEFEPWDDTMKVTRVCSAEEQQAIYAPSQARRSARRQPKKKPQASASPSTIIVTPGDNNTLKITETKPEPQYTLIGQKKDISLKISGTCDFVKTSVTIPNASKEAPKSIEFSTTMMHETRTECITVTNSSYIRIPYKWKSLNFKCINAKNVNPFFIEPEFGTLEGSSTNTFLVHFKPLEVDDFSCDFVFDIPVLSLAEERQSIHLTGSSKRPICHFDVKLNSDYLKHRHPDYSYSLPPDTRVVEIVSPELNMTKQLKFNIINTTNMMYESYWERVTDSDLIVTETPKQVISAHKEYQMLFDYTPKSSKIIESLWEFHIPEYNIVVPVLFLGKIGAE